MSLVSILLVCCLSFIVSIFSISVGGTSLITVPVLISLGMISKNAVATNMFALIFLSMSGAIGFRKEIRIPDHKIIAFLSILTIIGSLIGASLISAIEKNILKKVIAIIICIITCTFLFKKDSGVQTRNEKISKIKLGWGALIIFILGIYGGFFSGGYVTILSYVLILTFGLNFLQVAFITKILNIFSSLMACAFFYYHDLIDFSIGIPLAFSMSSGAFLGTKLALAKGNLWIRNIFIIAVILLAIKLLIF
ncbi:MAG: sulfite exporter TauE/SafE family protein [Candidatus Aminicenantes bacterium]|nr:MAG: sulfite exporter TauE/SafE family protein [Candidatus Aminicenantes bacterium]